MRAGDGAPTTPVAGVSQRWERGDVAPDGPDHVWLSGPPAARETIFRPPSQSAHVVHPRDAGLTPRVTQR